MEVSAAKAGPPDKGQSGIARKKRSTAKEKKLSPHNTNTQEENNDRDCMFNGWIKRVPCQSCSLVG